MPIRLSEAGLFASDAPQNQNPKTAAGEGWLHAHCDGGARGNPGPAGYGALLAEADGAVVAELSEFLGMRTNNYAEYSGLLGCLQYALDHGRGRLKVVSDSELMVKQIQGKYQVKSPDLKPLFDEAKRRIAKLDAFQIEHALRHKNKDADRLANEAMDLGMRKGGGMRKDGGMKRASPAAPAATPYPQKSDALPIPIALEGRSAARTVAAVAAGTMLRGFTRDGVVHLLGGAGLPDGVFVKVIPE